MIYQTLKQILIEKLGIEESIITPAAFIKRDLELDSTETVAVALELKKRKNVDFKFPSQDISLQQLCETIEETLACEETV